jgi:hypothetical protein
MIIHWIKKCSYVILVCKIVQPVIFYFYHKTFCWCCVWSFDVVFTVRCRRGRDGMVVGFTTTCLISAYHHYSCEFEPHSWRGVLDTTLCDKVCQWLASCRWFSLGTPVFSGYSGFLHHKNLALRYIWNIVGSGVKHYNTNPLLNKKTWVKPKITNQLSKYREYSKSLNYLTTLCK